MKIESYLDCANYSKCTEYAEPKSFLQTDFFAYFHAAFCSIFS